MLTAYRRHLKKCDHRAEGRDYRRCHCPIWVDGFLGDRDIRQSLKLRDWQRAQDKIREWEAENQITEAPAPAQTVQQACDAFLEDAQARNLQETTLEKYRLLFRRLQAFAAEQGIVLIAQCDLTMLRRFRAGWKLDNLAALKTLERLKAFSRFAWDAGWLAENFAKKLKNPKITESPTLPFTQKQMGDVLAACTEYPDRLNRARLRALVLLLRCSGLRIRDAVTLERSRIQGEKLFLYTAKTGTPVWCPLPSFVVEALETIPSGGQYFFWTGESKPKSAVGDWQRSLRRLFRLAGVPDGHAHRFRDTFAVELLLSQCAYRTGFDATRTQERERHRETLRPVGPRSTAATRGRCAPLVGHRFTRPCRNEGYTTGTREKAFGQLNENTGRKDGGGGGS